MAYEKSKVSSFGGGSLDSTPVVGFEYCHQFSRIAGEVPDAATLGEGEIAINLADGILYIRGSSGAVVAAGGSTANQVVSSGGLANLTSGQQDEVVVGTIVTTTDGRRWVYKGEGSKTQEASYIELADITPVWSVIADKPATFTPATHSHSISDVSGLQTAIDGKQASGSYAAASHTHAISDVTNLQTSLDGKAATSHTHTISSVTNLQTSLDGKVSSALPWASTHTSANGTQYNVGDLVYSSGNIYRAIATNDSIAVGNTSYWALVGTGYRLNIDLHTGLSTKVSSVTAGIAGADQITNIVSLTQAEYDALATKSATTLYVING
jgi:hypothetical protein